VGTVFQTYMEFLHEILVEFGAEVTSAPLRLAAEVVQFVILAGIVWVVAFGFGKRKGFVSNMLAERREAVFARIEEADGAPHALATAKQESAASTRSARAKARALVAQAKKDAVALETTTAEETNAEAERIVERAQAALETEREEMLLEVREQLIEIVSAAARAMMNEKMSVAEQRKLIESAITDSIESEPAAAGVVR
jgi:F-type H+-transporting ATPase subunit b